MRALIVSDTGSMIVLAKLDHLDLLFSSFNEVYPPKAVYQEITTVRHRLDAYSMHKD